MRRRLIAGLPSLLADVRKRPTGIDPGAYLAALSIPVKPCRPVVV